MTPHVSTKAKSKGKKRVDYDDDAEENEIAAITSAKKPARVALRPKVDVNGTILSPHERAP